MDAATITAIEQLSRRANATTLVVNGRTYSTVPLHEPKPAPMPIAVPIVLHSLEGLRALLESTANHPDAPGSYLVHVAGAAEVVIVSEVFGEHRQREVLARVEPILSPFEFGLYRDLESFIIALQSQFVPSDATAGILKLIGNIKDESVNTCNDDGVTQTVAARVGIVRLDTVPVPNPVTLAPYRTFAEIEQPASKFVLRLRSGVKDGEKPTAALFEADGGAWRVLAMAKITRWLAEALPETVRIIG